MYSKFYPHGKKCSKCNAINDTCDACMLLLNKATVHELVVALYDVFMIHPEIAAKSLRNHSAAEGDYSKWQKILWCINAIDLIRDTLGPLAEEVLNTSIADDWGEHVIRMKMPSRSQHEPTNAKTPASVR